MGQPICQVSPRGSGSVLETPESALLWAPEARAVVALGDQMLGLWLLGAQRGDVQVRGNVVRHPASRLTLLGGDVSRPGAPSRGGSCGPGDVSEPRPALPFLS